MSESDSDRGQDEKLPESMAENLLLRARVQELEELLAAANSEQENSDHPIDPADDAAEKDKTSCTTVSFSEL
jgi:hypothetical protein